MPAGSYRKPPPPAFVIPAKAGTQRRAERDLFSHGRCGTFDPAGAGSPLGPGVRFAPPG
jgi:hypothetical protein